MYWSSYCPRFMSVCYVVIFSCLILVLCSTASADGAFRWIDKNGNAVFGSHPPRGALNVERLDGKSFSRYSSESLLEAYRPMLEDTETESFPQKPAKLEAGRLQIKHDSQHRVTSCKVPVKNRGDQLANNVLVSFEFENGTIVPATGPDSIAGNSETVYYIAAEHLPVTVTLNAGRRQSKTGL